MDLCRAYVARASAFSQIATDHMDQAADLSDIVRVLESNMITVTMQFLRDHNIDIRDDECAGVELRLHNIFEARVKTYTNFEDRGMAYTIFGDGSVNTGDNSQVTMARV